MNKYTLLVILIIAFLAPQAYSTGTTLSTSAGCVTCLATSSNWVCGTAIGTAVTCCATGDTETACVSSSTSYCTDDSDIFPDDTSKRLLCLNDSSACTPATANQVDTYSLVDDYTTQLAASTATTDYIALDVTTSCYYTATTSGTDVRRYNIATSAMASTTATAYSGSLSSGFTNALTIAIITGSVEVQGFSVASAESAYVVLVTTDTTSGGTWDSTITAKEAASTTCSSSDDGLSGGAIAGIVIGCVAFVGLAGVGVFVAVKLLCKPAK